jgi:uncharacterized membrane protein
LDGPDTGALWAIRTPDAEPETGGQDRMTATGTDAERTEPGTATRTAVRHHPTVALEAQKRSSDIQLAIADRITAFAGTMWFVYAHAVLFAAWMLFVERSPWQTLTLIVSLEAIFLSTFVMIGQNRQAAFQQAKADRDFSTSEAELHTNTELTRQIRELTQRIHEQVSSGAAHPTPPEPTG